MCPTPHALSGARLPFEVHFADATAVGFLNRYHVSLNAGLLTDVRQVPDLRGDLEMAKAALGVAARSLSRRIAADPAI